MEKAINLIFSQISERIENQLKSEKANKNSEGDENLTISDSSNFEIHVDGQGNASQEITQRGYGATINAKAFIVEPKDGIFDIDVTSTGGGSISKRGIKANDAVEGRLKMEGGLCRTTIRIRIHSSIPNTLIKGRLDYWT